MYRVIKKNAQKYIKSKSNKTIYVYTNSAIQNLTLDQSCVKFHIDEISKDVAKIDSFIDKFNQSDEIIAIGGGSVIDVCKYLAYKTNKKLSVVMTMISTNAFSTDKVCLINNNKKITIQAKTPNVVIFDENLLKKAGNFNNWGLCDVLSIHTALYDWNIANTYNKERINKYYRIAYKLLEKVKVHILNNFENLNDYLWKSFKFIEKSGIITNKYGSGRPESGSEHIYSKEVEKRIDKVPHGLAVINGIKIMSEWQNNIDQKIEKIYDMFEIEKYNKSFGITLEMLHQINNTIQPREDRFSIIDIKRGNYSDNYQ